MDLNIFADLFSLGMHPVPILWDVNTKQAVKYPEHGDMPDGKPRKEDVARWLENGFKSFNAIALKMFPPFGMFDFDLKNTDKKGVYDEWFKIISSVRPEILSKLCIETTRSGGYHCYIKYAKLEHKIPVARNSEGFEVISVYTGGLLSFCTPSPDYRMFHNEFTDLDFLTDDEFDFLVKSAAYFNEYEDLQVGQSKVAVIDYPVEYENICLQFDNNINDEVYETLLNSIDLYRVKDQRMYQKKKWVAFLREGSNAAYSGKVYFTNKRLLIFSASMSKFPTWHDSARMGDNTWSLSPSKIVYYKNNKEWGATIEEIKMICESADIPLIEQQPITNQPIKNEDRLKFPYDIFPEEIQNYISYQRLQHEYLAGCFLMAASTAIGNTVYLQALQNYKVKPILYMVVVSPSGGGKSPSLGAAFNALEEHDTMLAAKHAELMKEYNTLLAAWKSSKSGEEPKKPDYQQILIKDSTIEMVIKTLSINTSGCCLVADEMTGFLNRMNAYKSGDDVQKWLEMWNGSPILLQRITRDENRVPEPFCNIIGGIQSSLLDVLSKAENEFNGFFHRFLFVYPKPEAKPDFDELNMPCVVEHDLSRWFSDIIAQRVNDKLRYTLSEGAKAIYKEWHDYKNVKYNMSTSDQVKGIISKYQNYCLRLALIIQVMEDRRQRKGIISLQAMERAIRLTEYFLGNMYKAVKVLTPETPVDKLTSPYDLIYNELPNTFSSKTAFEIGSNHNLKESNIKMFLSRYQKGERRIFNQIERGKYEKLY